MATQETINRYHQFLRDCWLTKKFSIKEMIKVHGVSTNASVVLKKLEFVNTTMGRNASSHWLKPEPTEKTAQIVLEAIAKYATGAKINPKEIAGGQQAAIEEKKQMTVAEAISVLKAKGYKIMAPKTEWVEV